MSDSLQNIDKRCIFRETFENEQSVRRNGGIVPTGMSFTKGSIYTAGIAGLYFKKYIPFGTYTDSYGKDI